MKPSDPEFAQWLGNNREAVAAITSRIDVLESQLARGSRKITPAVLDKFSQQLSAKLHDEDSALRSAYLRMLVSEVKVSKDRITITGSKSVLERGLAKGLPRLEGSVPIFDQIWCQKRHHIQTLFPHIFRYLSNSIYAKSPQKALKNRLMHWFDASFGTQN